jgi:two-component system chemotaxis response regulator CheY
MSKPEKQTRKFKILIVDDVPNMRKTLRGMLYSIGYKDVIEADDGDTALAQIKSNPVDIVIADWIMPRMPGVELLTEIREDPRMRDMPFILITGETDEAQITRAAEEDVDGYIIKPFVATVFEKKIKTALEKKANPPLVETHIKTGMVYTDNGMFNEALVELEKAQSIAPNSARIELAKARIHEKMGDMKKAEKCVKTAMTLNPKYLKAYNRMAELQIKKGNEEAAMEALMAVAKISPNNPKRLFVIGKYQLKQGKLEEAKTSFLSALSNSRRDKELFGEVGEAYLASGHEDMAIDAFKNSLDIVENVHIYNRLGIALRRKKLYREAIENYKKALLLDDNDEVLHFNIALVYQDDRQTDLAIAEFKTALRLNPDFKECQDALNKVESGQDSINRPESALPWDTGGIGGSSNSYDNYNQMGGDKDLWN